MQREAQADLWTMNEELAHQASDTGMHNAKHCRLERERETFGFELTKS